MRKAFYAFMETDGLSEWKRVVFAFNENSLSPLAWKKVYMISE